MPAFLQNIFGYLECNEHRMSNATQAVMLLESGRTAIGQRQWERLRDVNHALVGLMPNEARREMETTIGF